MLPEDHQNWFLQPYPAYGGLGSCRGECVCAAMPYCTEEPPRDVCRTRAWAESFMLLCLPSTLQQNRAWGLCKSTALQKGYQAGNAPL